MLNEDHFADAKSAQITIGKRAVVTNPTIPQTGSLVTIEGTKCWQNRKYDTLTT